MDSSSHQESGFELSGTKLPPCIPPVLDSLPDLYFTDFVSFCNPQFHLSDNALNSDTIEYFHVSDFNDDFVPIDSNEIFHPYYLLVNVYKFAAVASNTCGKDTVYFRIFIRNREKTKVNFSGPDTFTVYADPGMCVYTNSTKIVNDITIYSFDAGISMYPACFPYGVLTDIEYSGATLKRDVKYGNESIGNTSNITLYYETFNTGITKVTYTLYSSLFYYVLEDTEVRLSGDTIKYVGSEYSFYPDRLTAYRLRDTIFFTPYSLDYLDFYYEGKSFIPLQKFSIWVNVVDTNAVYINCLADPFREPENCITGYEVKGSELDPGFVNRTCKTLTLKNNITNTSTLEKTWFNEGSYLIKWYLCDSSFVLDSCSYTLIVKPLNKVINGDFEKGDDGFNTDYTSCNTQGCLTAGQYAVGRDPYFYNSILSGNDHTSGSGNFLLLNGHGSYFNTVWSQTIKVKPFTTYYFSFWVSSLNTVSPASLFVSYNGNDMSGSGWFPAPDSTSLWKECVLFWNTGYDTSVVLSIKNLNTEADGNDFGIDDIRLVPSCCGAGYSIGVNVYSGSVTLQTQSELNNFYNSGDGENHGNKWTKISGDLTLLGNDSADPITNLCNLNEIQEISGKLILKNFSKTESPVSTLDLVSLSKIGKVFQIINNPSLQQILLPSLTKIGGSLFIRNNHQVKNIDFPYLNEIGGDVLHLFSNSGVEAISFSDSSSGFSFTHPNADIYIQQNGDSALNPLKMNFRKIRTINGNLRFSKNNSPGVSNFDEIFGALDSVGKALVITDNSYLGQCCIAVGAKVPNGRSISGNTGNCLNLSVVNSACVPLNKRADNLVIKPEDDVSEILLYPNPGSGIIYLESLNSDLNIHEIDLFNHIGQAVVRTIIRENNSIRIQIDKPLVGVYFLRVRTVNGYITRKLTIDTL
ncbi:MAG: T9SS type A sorting domain-containing protein [Flavobacteriales bacterium]|nr:T9SS type A sorting domain-containing protein [Flavobacteriales bacterium]